MIQMTKPFEKWDEDMLCLLGNKHEIGGTSVRDSLVLNWFWLAVFVVGLGVFMVSMPKYYDDLWYMYDLRVWYASQGITDVTAGGDVIRYGVPWDAIKTTWDLHYYYDNARIANIVAVPLLLFPKWVGSLFALAMWCVAMWASFRIAGVDIRKSALVPVAVFLWSFGIVWQQHMGSMVYQMNYVVSTGLALWLIWESLFRGAGGRKLLEVFLVGVLTGSWHEGFSVPVIVGFVVLMIVYKKYRNKSVAIATAGLMIGLLWIVISPSFAARTGQFGVFDIHAHTASGLLKAFLTHPLFLIYTGFVLFCAIHKGHGVMRHNALILLVMSIGITAIMMQWLTTGVQRVGWMADVMSAIGILAMLRENFGGFRNEYNAKNVFVAIALMILVSLHWISVGEINIKLARQYAQVTEKYVKERSKEIFVDFTTFEDLPLINLMTSDCRIFLMAYQTGPFEAFYNARGELPPLNVIPSQLEYVTSESGREMEGNSGWRNIGNHYFARVESKEEPKNRIATVDFGCFSKSDIVFSCRYFTSRKDGERYVYFYPDRPLWSMDFFEIKSIYL